MYFLFVLAKLERSNTLLNLCFRVCVCIISVSSFRRCQRLLWHAVFVIRKSLCAFPYRLTAVVSSAVIACRRGIGDTDSHPFEVPIFSRAEQEDQPQGYRMTPRLGNLSGCQGGSHVTVVGTGRGNFAKGKFRP